MTPREDRKQTFEFNLILVIIGVGQFVIQFTDPDLAIHQQLLAIVFAGLLLSVFTYFNSKDWEKRR